MCMVFIDCQYWSVLQNLKILTLVLEEYILKEKKTDLILVKYIEPLYHLYYTHMNLIINISPNMHVSFH